MVGGDGWNLIPDLDPSPRLGTKFIPVPIYIPIQTRFSWV